jgi:hypothetical protein
MYSNCPPTLKRSLSHIEILAAHSIRYKVACYGFLKWPWEGQPLAHIRSLFSRAVSGKQGLEGPCEGLQI